MTYLLIWIALGAIVGAAIGQSKGRSLAGAAWGIFLGPIGWLVIGLAPDQREYCSECGGDVVPGARRCKNCGCSLSPEPSPVALEDYRTIEDYKQWKATNRDPEDGK